MFGQYYTSIYDCTLTPVVCVNFIIQRIDLNPFLSLDIYVIYLVMHKYVQMTFFFPTFFSAKDDYFRVSLLSIEDNWWGRASMVSLSSWWVLWRFNLLHHIYVGFANMSFCERLSYITFNSTSVLFNRVFFNLVWPHDILYSITYVNLFLGLLTSEFF